MTDWRWTVDLQNKCPANSLPIRLFTCLFKRTYWFCNLSLQVRAILDAGLSPILCIGESKAEYEAGRAQEVCAAQLRGGLLDITAEEMFRIVIAYEPVWAIGTGLTATPAIAQAIHLYIRSVLAALYSERVAAAVRIQYGGSVTPESVDELMACPDIDGCLVGGASLVADKFARIIGFQPLPGPRKLYAQEVVPADCTLGEAPVWSSSAQRLFWVDSVGKAVWSWDTLSPPVRWDSPETVGCVALQEGGDLLLGLDSGLFTFSPATGAARKLTDFEPGLNTRPNDGRVDREGNFVIGSYNNSHRQDGSEIGGLWRLTPDGRLQEILDYKFRCSNCICFSPDGRIMYFCDTPTRRIYAFDYSPSGKLFNRRLLYEMPSSLNGGPDGAQTDAQGYLWACLSGAGQVVRLSPGGVVDRVVEVPVASPTSCTIGGAAMDKLYITTRKPDGGGLYAVNLPDGIVGNPEPEFRGRELAAAAAAAVSSVHAAQAAQSRGHQQSQNWLSGILGNGSSGPGKAGGGGSAFCDSCGMAYPRASSKFCAQCGTPRP